MSISGVAPNVFADEPVQIGPDNVILALLGWIGAPALVITIVSLTLGLLAWKNFAHSMADAVAEVHQFIELRSSLMRRRAITLVLAQAVCVGVAYSLSQLFTGGFSRVINDTQAGTSGLGHILSAALSYRWWNGTTGTAVATVVIASVCMNILVATSNLGILNTYLKLVRLLSGFLAASGALAAFMGLITIGSSVADEQRAAIWSFIAAAFLVAGGIASWTAIHTSWAMASEAVNSDPYSPRRWHRRDY